MSSVYLIPRYASHAAAVAAAGFPSTVFTPFTLYDRTVGASPITETGTVPATPYQIQLPVPASTSGLAVTVGGAARTVVSTTPSSGQVKLDRTSGVWTFYSGDEAGSYSITMTPLATAIMDQMFARVQAEVAAVQTYALTTVVGAASSTDNAIARFDGTTGKVVQNSGVTIADTGAITVSGITSQTGITSNATTGKGLSATVTGSGGIAGYFCANGNGTTGITCVTNGSATAATFLGSTLYAVTGSQTCIDVDVQNSNGHGIYIHDDIATGASTYLLGIRAYNNGNGIVLYDSAGTVNARLSLSGAVNTGYAYLKDGIQIGLGSTGSGLLFGADGTPGTLKPAALTGTRAWTLPDASGTVALTSQIPAAFDPASPGAIGGTTPAAVTGTTLTATAQVGCEVYHSTTQTVAAADTAILFDSEDSDTGACHSTSSNTSRLTAPTAGTYLITATIGTNDDISGNIVRAWIAKNGAILSSSPRYAQSINDLSGSSGGGAWFSLSYVLTLAANDYLEIYVSPTGGSDYGSATVSLQNRASFKRLY